MLVCCPTLLTTWPRHPCEDSFVEDNNESIPKREWTPGPQTGRLAQSSQVFICLPPLLGHHPMVTSLLDWSKVIIRPMKDGDDKRTFELGPIVTMGFKCEKPNQPNPLQQDSPVCLLPRQQPTPGLSGTQWLEDLFPSKQPEFHLISTFDSSDLTFPPSLEPSQTDEPPIPARVHPPSHMRTFRLLVSLHPTPSSPSMICPSDPPPPSPLIPTMTLTRISRLTTDLDDSSSHCSLIHQPNLVGALPIASHDSLCGCNSLKLDAPGIPGGTKLPPFPGTGGLSKGGHHGDSLKIP
ncbi:hypothetical protein O181_064718 [Austropuccinia psidii MF-1]|uniref:Uncharacterized protein n=1 Tax=Austropuccinia psidii MF-1 TaxID=1389203 RepID=A0A9Q3ENG3_9BASI|nr:hypothetical protein [Austropuccinia psidii MF-1]